MLTILDVVSSSHMNKHETNTVNIHVTFTLMLWPYLVKLVSEFFTLGPFTVNFGHEYTEFLIKKLFTSEEKTHRRYVYEDLCRITFRNNRQDHSVYEKCLIICSS